jgi:tetratricopeptide (TPR) repeat protein
MLELGDLKLKQKKYDEAEKCLLAAEGKGDTAMRALAASELGDCFFAQKKLDKAKEHYEQALALWEKAGKTYDINRAICSAELAKTLLQLGTPERADSLYQSAIASLKDLSSSKALYKDICINYAAFLWSQWRVFDAFAEQSRIQKLGS